MEIRSLSEEPEPNVAAVLPGGRLLVNVFACGSTEDGRCGIGEVGAKNSGSLQTTPTPLASLRIPGMNITTEPPRSEQYVSHAISAGSRHSLLLQLARDFKNEESSTQTSPPSDPSSDRSKLPSINRPSTSSSKPSTASAATSTDAKGGWKTSYHHGFLPKRTRRVLITGLMQVGLCEEAGHKVPQVFTYDADAEDPPVTVIAGRGTTFLLTRDGMIWSAGFNKYGQLGLETTTSVTIPRLVSSLVKKQIRQLSTGGDHTLALSSNGELYGWGRNHKGQVGVGEDNIEAILKPTRISFPGLAQRPAFIMNVSAGAEHSVALLKVCTRTAATTNSRYSTGSGANSTSPVLGMSEEEVWETQVFCWGDESRGQLGSGDREFRNRPQENRWVSRLLRRLGFSLREVVAGGHFTLALTAETGQVISWGGNEYGQLGHGNQFDDPQPRIIVGVERVAHLSAGYRHSMAIVEGSAAKNAGRGASTNASSTNRTKIGTEIYSWGFNGFGELGVGDCNIRLQPTLVGSLIGARPISVSCGERHSLILTSAVPVAAADEFPSVRKYRRILMEGGNTAALRRRLQSLMEREGLAPSLLESSGAYIEGLPGSEDSPLIQNRYDPGLRYCLDSNTVLSGNSEVSRKRAAMTVKRGGNAAATAAAFSGHRQPLEIVYECTVPGRVLKQICLACARNCVASLPLRAYTRRRKPNDACGCRMSGHCECVWSPIRAAFDSFASVHDNKITADDVFSLLRNLRAPFAVESSEVEECVNSLSDGSGKIRPVPFERWYRRFYEDSDPLQDY